MIGLRHGLWLLAALAVPANAQESATSPNLRDRTGPNAEIEPPAFPQAPARPFAEPVAPLPGGVSGIANFGSIAVDEPGAAVAVAGSDWNPGADSATGLRLTRSARLDGAWIREQFARNGLVGQPVPLDRVVALVQLINRAFIANGYINSGVLIAGDPPVDGGTLTLRVILGRTLVESGTTGFAVAWADGRSKGLGEKFVRERMTAADAVPLNAIDVERQFRQLTENPAIRTVDANLQPGTRPGEARLTLLVEPAPRFDFYLTAANNRSPSIGGERYAIGGSMRNLLAGGDLLSAEGGITGKRADVLASYDLPLFDTATSVLVRGGYNDAAVTDPQLRPLDISATDWNVEGGLARIVAQRPLLPGAVAGQWHAARTITVGLRFAHRNSKTYLFGVPFSFSPGSVNGRSHYSALRLTADWVERGIDTVYALSLTATQGLGGTKSDNPDLLAPDRDFRTFRAQASFARRLSGKGMELRVRLGGQWADGTLYSGERFAAGGAQTVRGYRETLLLADTGLTGTIELAQPFRLAASRRELDWSAFVFSVFADGALLHNRAGQQSVPREIGSLGASLAWTPSPAIAVKVIYGHALKDPPITGRRDLQDRGFHFSVTLRPFEF